MTNRREPDRARQVETEVDVVEVDVTEAAPAVPAGVRRAIDVRRALVAAASGVCVLGLTAGAVLADDRLPVADLAPVVPPVVDVSPPPEMLVCPGRLHVATEVGEGDDIAYDPQFDTTPAESVTTLTALVLGSGDGVLTGPGGSTPVPSGAAATFEDPGAVTLTVPGEVDRLVAASLVSRTEEGDLRGAAAAPCSAPASEHWLVGGSTALGSGARLVLQNPGRTASSVRVDVWGPVGPIDLSGAPDFLVPAGEQRVVMLEGLAAEQRRVVVRTTVRGGLVHAHLQDSELRGLTPAGVALVTPGAPPATEQVVAGIDVEASEADGVDTAVLRLLAPEEGTEVGIRLLGEDGPVDLPGVAEVRLDAGAVLDVPLGGLPAGVYAAVVRSDEPVVAAAMTTRGLSAGAAASSTLDPLDRAWLASQVPGGDRALAVPPVIPRQLVLANVASSGRDVVVRAYDADGVPTDTEVDVRSGATVRLPFGDLGDPAPVAVRVLGEDVAWSATLVGTDPGGDHLAALVAPAQPQRQDQVTIDVR